MTVLAVAASEPDADPSLACPGCVCVTSNAVRCILSAPITPGQERSGFERYWTEPCAGPRDCANPAGPGPRGAAQCLRALQPLPGGCCLAGPRWAGVHRRERGERVLRPRQL